MSKQPGLERALKDLRKAKEDLSKLVETRAPTIVGVEAVNWVRENFDKESYMGNKWEPRSPATNAAYDKRSGVKGSVYNSAAKLLQQSMNLFDGIRKKVVNRSVFIGFDPNKIPYGKIHNEGGIIQKNGRVKSMYFSGNRFASKGKGEGRNVIVKAHEIKMPKRQFLPLPGEPCPPVLRTRILKKLIFEREKILAKFAKLYR